MFLLSVGEITAIIGAAATVMTTFLVPIRKAIKKKQKQKEDERREKEEDREKINSIAESINEIKQSSLNNTRLIAETRQSQIEQGEKIDQLMDEQEHFFVQNLKYMINDAYFGYPNIHEIPDDILKNACECCEIYVNQKRRNHEIKPRCELFWREVERRAIHREVHDE